MSTSTDIHAPEGELIERVQVDYFGFTDEREFVFPDGVSKIFFRAMNEGGKTRFQKAVQRDLTIEKTSGNARVRVDPGVERHELIKASVTGWNLVRRVRGELAPLPFNLTNLNDFLVYANPQVVEDLEKAIRKANPWLLAELEPEEIETQIEELQEALERARERKAGEEGSSSR